MKQIEQKWLEYRSLVVPPNASAEQLKQLRWAFYGGASVLLLSIVAELGEDGEDERDVARLHALKDEIEDFGREIDAAVVGDPQRN